MNKFLFPLPLWQHTGIGIIRIIVGLMLVYHGWELFDKEVMKGYTTWDSFKGFSSPSFVIYMGKAFELIGGLLLLAGLFTRLACLIIIGTFLYITFFVGHGKFWYEDQHPFLFVVIAIMFFFTGPGKWSADALLFQRKA